MQNAISHCASQCQLMASAAEGVQGRVSRQLPFLMYCHNSMVEERQAG